LGKKGKIGFENSSPLSGAGENKRTLTDIVHHEIAYSERQALAVLGNCFHSVLASSCRVVINILSRCKLLRVSC